MQFQWTISLDAVKLLSHGRFLRLSTQTVSSPGFGDRLGDYSQYTHSRCLVLASGRTSFLFFCPYWSSDELALF